MPQVDVPGVGLAQQDNASHDQLLAVAQRTLQRGPVRLSQIEEVYIEVAMQLSENNISRAATLLGLSRAQLDYRLKKMSSDESATQ
ncbi:DNA-binding protein Fis [compost metagenome]